MSAEPEQALVAKDVAHVHRTCKPLEATHPNINQSPWVRGELREPPLHRLRLCQHLYPKCSPHKSRCSVHKGSEVVRATCSPVRLHTCRHTFKYSTFCSKPRPDEHVLTIDVSGELLLPNRIQEFCWPRL